jgi:molybdopterin converting factor subunit 1
MRVLFFGRLRDIAGTSELDTGRAFDTLAELRRWLTDTHADLAPALAQRGVRIAIDKTIVKDADASLRAAKEVAFMPPMSGG